MMHKRLSLAAATLLVVGVAAGSAIGAPDDKTVVKDGLDRFRGPNTDLRKVKAVSGGNRVRFVVRVDEAHRRITPELTYVLIAALPNGERYYLSEIPRDQPQRRHERIPAKFQLRGDRLLITTSKRTLGGPQVIRWKAVSGGDDNEDVAPDKGRAKLRTA